MRKIITICKKEIKDYFLSPIAYIIISIFLLVTGWFFFSTFFVMNQANLRDFFSLLPITLSFIIPAITMRTLSEEFNVGSYELLITFPVQTQDIVIGKFFALLIFIIIMLIPTISYPICVNFVGDLDWGPVIGGYIGAIFLGASFCAIGIFSSSLTKNQINSFIIATIICLILSLIDKMLFFLPDSIVNLANYFASSYHFQNFSKGVIDSRDIIYFLSITFLFLYATNLSLNSKR